MITACPERVRLRREIPLPPSMDCEEALAHEALRVREYVPGA